MADMTTIDAAGRVVIPKPLRDALGLLPTTRLRVRESGGCVVLEPVARATLSIERDGLVLIGGELVGPPPDVRGLREERVHEVARRASRKRRG